MTWQAKKIQWALSTHLACHDENVLTWQRRSTGCTLAVPHRPLMPQHTWGKPDIHLQVRHFICHTTFTFFTIFMHPSLLPLDTSITGQNISLHHTLTYMTPHHTQGLVSQSNIHLSQDLITHTLPPVVSSSGSSQNLFLLEQCYRSDVLFEPQQLIQFYYYYFFYANADVL